MKRTFTFTLLLSLLAATVSGGERSVKFDSVPWERVVYLVNQLSTYDPANIRKAFEEYKKMPGYDGSKYEKIVWTLENRAQSMNSLSTGSAKAIGTAEATLKDIRAVLLSNPLLAGDKIIAARYDAGDQYRYITAPALGTQAGNETNQLSGWRQGAKADIVELTNLLGDHTDVKVRTIYAPENNRPVTDLLLNWDGERIMFTSIDNKTGKWNVFEVMRDGTGLRKVIDSPEADLEFFDAAYMPSGKIIANTTVGYQGVPCVDGSDPVGNLVEYDPVTKNMRRLTFDQDANWHPRVLNNGRLMYVRWEYTDLPHYYSRFVMHANPDGTETKALYGSGGWWPNSIFDVQPLPGGNNTFIGITAGHHGTTRCGSLYIFDPAKGRKEEKGVVQQIPYSGRPVVPEIKDRLSDNVWPLFMKPWPLNDKFFLVTAKWDLYSPWNIYLVDVFDNVTLLASFKGMGLTNPILVSKRPVPPVIPDRVNLDKKDATFFIQDIYQGEGLPGVKRGTVKKLRVFAYEYAYVSSPSNHMAQGIQSGWDIKRPLGTVDVEADGSVMFKAPANTPISMQPLDDEGRAIQWMRSWVSAMPGEVVSCVGCHEDQNSVPIPKRAMASLKPAKDLTPPEGGVRSFTFDYEIQPILDRACVSCHNQKSKLDFRGGIKVESSPLTRVSSDGKQKISASTSYFALHPYVNRQGPEADIYVMRPYEYHASTSELIKVLKRGHYGVELADSEWRTIYEWIDLNAPYHGYFIDSPIKRCRDQYARRIELTNKYANGAGVDWRKELNDYAAYLKAKGPITPAKVNVPAKPKYKDVKAAGWPFTPDQARDMAARLGESKKKVEIAPGVEIAFVRIPAGTFVMGDNVNGKTNAPASVVTIDKPFWMAETELTNAQYKVVFPAHDSRYIAQFWKDHVGPGYPANGPAQPVIRVSWNQAMDYCARLSRTTGLKITLPTEAQWEWACRAGSASPMWYGGLDADFTKYDNLADMELRKMAVRGVDPKPMGESQFDYPFFIYIPRNDALNDGNMLVCDVAGYQANPWGLYDMHGNVAEFTRSDYAPYPYDAAVAAGDMKVVRGGTWVDRTKNSGAYSRDEFFAWQPSNKTGFRLIIED